MDLLSFNNTADEMTAQIRRKREDKIGKLMGEYLLKGYKMLGSTCSVCGTILLRDRKQQDYCIGCNEIDERVHLAPPFNQTSSTVVNQQVNSDHILPCLTDSIAEGQEVVNKTPHGPQSNSSEGCDKYSDKCFDGATSKLHERITWAAGQLGRSNSVEMDVKLSKLIHSCAKALKTLNELHEQTK